MTDHTESSSVIKLRIAYGEAIRLMSQQEVTLDELRARTGTLLGLFVVATAFFGSALTRGRHVTDLQRAALIVFLLVLLLQASVLLVHGDWYFTTEGRNNIDDAIGDCSVEDYYKGILEELESSSRCNDKKLEPLQWRFTCSVVLVFVNMVLWTLSILIR